MTFNLYLQNFRSYSSNTFTIENGFNVIHGPNGAGKTNLVEAISMLSPGQGLRKARLATMLRHENSFWHISAVINENQIAINYNNNIKNLLWNGVKISASEIIDEIGISWLTPQIMFNFWKDHQIRRNFLDRIVSNYASTHTYHYVRYEKMRLERNKLLGMGSTDLSAYHVIEKIMVTDGIEVIMNRAKAIKELNLVLGNFGGLKPCKIELSGDIEKNISDNIASLRDFWLRKLENSRNLLVTNIGPHKTDFRIWYGQNDGIQCSTGEQNMIIISLLLASFTILKQEIKILLLDDVFSHLDLQNRASLFDMISEISPTYTCITDVEKVSNNLHENFIPLL